LRGKVSLCEIVAEVMDLIGEDSEDCENVGGTRAGSVAFFEAVFVEGGRREGPMDWIVIIARLTFGSSGSSSYPRKSCLAILATLFDLRGNPELCPLHHFEFISHVLVTMR
jgi:hypothetical protein